jgi:LPS-assembly lipoprotein
MAKTPSRMMIRPLLRMVPLLGLAAVAACGFHPMDARAPGGDAPAALAGIAVAPIKDRVGQVMRTGIERRLNPTGLVVPETHSLKVQYTATTVARGVRNDDSAIRNDYTLNVDFKLITASKDDTPAQVLMEGTTIAVTRHNNPEQLYAGYVSAREAEERAADMAAEDIARQIRLYFRNPANYTAPVEAPTPTVPHERPTRP